VLRREPIPTARAILWKPLPDSYHLLASMMRGPDPETQLFITQRAFLQVEQHLASAPDLELGGFLAGHRYECPRTRAQYSIVNTTVPFAEVTGDPLGARVTQRAYMTARMRLDAHGLSLIGWYRNGSGLGLQLLPDDIETHLAYFHEPWQTTMLVLPDASRPRGGFFTYDPRVGRSYCIPFHELPNPGRADDQRPVRTVVGWKTYVASVPVRPMPAEDREVAATRVSPIVATPEPEPPDAIDEWWDAIKDPWVRLKDAAVSARQPNEELAGLEWDPASKPPQAVPLELPRPAAPVPPQVVPVEVPRPAATVQAPPTAEASPVGGAPARSAPPNGQPKGSPRATVPPFSGAPRPHSGPLAEPVSRTVPPEPVIRAIPADPVIRTASEKPEPGKAPAVPRGKPSAAPRPTSTPKPRPILAAARAAMETAAAPGVPTPEISDEDPGRWRRWRHIGFAVAAASFLGALALASFRTQPQQEAQAATADSMSEAADSAAAAAPPTTIATGPEMSILPLPAAVDSLSDAIAHYRNVEDDHRRARVGCRALQRAYDRVNLANGRFGIARGAQPGALGTADSLRVAMTRAEYTHVSQMHRRSGCQG
jgi:hypothetical protein